MKEYHYKAKKTTTDIVEGAIKAESKEAALIKLSEEGLYPFDLKEKHESKSYFKEFLKPKKVSNSKMADLTRNISDLLDGGVSVLEAFNIVSKQISHPLLKEILEKIKKDLRDGQALSWSMQNQNKFFSPLFINLVKAGEVSGTLEASFLRIADFYEKRSNLRNSLLKSISYPVFLLFVGLLTLSILFIFVLPKLLPVFEDMEVNIPFVTQVLLNIAAVVKSYWKLLIGVLGVAFLIARKFLSTKEGRLFYQKILLKLPYIQTIVLKKDLAESFYSLGTLIQNGVPPVQALEITKDSMDNIPLNQNFDAILTNFKKGKSISVLMEGSRFFFPEAVNMIRVGEKTGSLEKPLLKLSQKYERDVQRSLEAFITIVEPAMILIFGATIGFVAIAILLPIFQLNFSVT